jgi:hypothetical protein
MGITQPEGTVLGITQTIIILVMADITESTIITAPIITNGLIPTDITGIGIISHTADTTEALIIIKITIISAIIINAIIINAIIINEAIIREKDISTIGIEGIIISGTTGGEATVGRVIAKAVPEA